MPVCVARLLNRDRLTALRDSVLILCANFKIGVRRASG